jgi:hypothetical protein
VPLSRRDTEAYRDKEDALAWMVGLHVEHRFDAHRVNDRDLINRPPQYDCFQESWEKVLAMREKLLAMAGLSGALRPVWQYCITLCGIVLFCRIISR